MRRPIVTLIALAFAGLISLGGTSGVIAQDAPAHPAHIHTGTCATLGDVIAPLSDVGANAMNNGTPMAMDQVGSAEAIPVMSSVTTVDLALSDILAGEHAINIHESAENIGNYIACGDIGGTMIGSTDILFGIRALNDSGLTGVGSLHDNGDGTTTVYVYLTADAEDEMATPEASPVS